MITVTDSALGSVATLKSSPESLKKIVCVGRNYAEHVKELGNDLPTKPIFFLKPTTAYIRSGQKIETPPGCEDLQHEIEFGVVIGKLGKNIPKDEAMEWVAGYALALDMTARYKGVHTILAVKSFKNDNLSNNLRDEQRAAKEARVPWTLAKMFDTSCPVGNFIPKQDIQDPHNIDIWVSVNGEMKQNSNTKHFIFKIPTLLAYVSKFITLEPGDLVLTGSPAGVSRVLPGDILKGGLAENGQELTAIEFQIA